MKYLLKPIMYLLVLIVIILGGLILLGTLTYYQPDERTMVLQSQQPAMFSDTAEISLLTWNLGYAGLGADMDFFYDGGSKTRSSRLHTLENLQAITGFIENHSQTDFLFLQEADQRAKRSYHMNIPDTLNKILPHHWHAYGKNYMVRFVPVPFYAPMGTVNSGIMTISPKAPIITERVSFPGRYPWPDRLFNLNRCMLMSRYPVTNGAQLVVINTHNSAFDDGKLRTIQMNFMKEIMLEEYGKGNYVIAGGDWNQCPPDFLPEFQFNLFDTLDVMYIPKDFLPGWKWAYDPEVPTNRRLKAPYDPSETLTTLIDFFIFSPNINILEVKGIHMNFKHSDHNPVFSRIKLNGH